MRCLFAGLFLVLGGAVSADSYRPDILEFEVGSALSFPGDEAFTLAEQGTLEFWLATGWDQDPGYDPVVVANVGDSGYLYVVSVLGDRSGISLQSGDEIDELELPMTGDQLQHIALVNLGGSVVVMVNGRVVGEFALTLQEGTSQAFHLGSAPADTSPFTGALGGLRLWNVALARPSLVTFAMQNPLSEQEPHPDLESLTAYSRLHEDTIELTSGDEPPGGNNDVQ